MKVTDLLQQLALMPQQAEVRIKDSADISGIYPKGHPVGGVSYHAPQNGNPYWISVDFDGTAP